MTGQTRLSGRSHERHKWGLCLLKTELKASTISWIWDRSYGCWVLGDFVGFASAVGFGERKTDHVICLIEGVYAINYEKCTANSQHDTRGACFATLMSI